ncbi:MAG: alpha/beta fold hydrolase [Deltaproteobacteria bacterium]|nr:alpha/beta fold hydrolase [Deltaproteobacteria bacterium]
MGYEFRPEREHKRRAPGGPPEQGAGFGRRVKIIMTAAWPSSSISQPFTEPEHQAFHWRRGSDAALLIHGFPGTPAELRPLGQLLQKQGWTVDAPLLPGFGAELPLLEKKYAVEWVDAVRDSYARLARQHSRILMVGNSMGGALALTVAAEVNPAGLVLMAPFTRMASRRHQLFWPLIRCFVRQVYPFQKADLSAPDLRRALSRMFKDADLDDAQTQRQIRALSLPAGVLSQLRVAGSMALASAPRVRAAVLILQGRNDLTVTPATTRTLIRRLPAGPLYVELPAGHDLTEPAGSAWPAVVRHVLEFAGGVKQGQ